jgi:hypothetical protein
MQDFFGTLPADDTIHILGRVINFIKFLQANPGIFFNICASLAGLASISKLGKYGGVMLGPSLSLVGDIVDQKSSSDCCSLYITRILGSALFVGYLPTFGPIGLVGGVCSSILWNSAVDEAYITRTINEIPTNMDVVQVQDHMIDSSTQTPIDIHQDNNVQENSTSQMAGSELTIPDDADYVQENGTNLRIRHQHMMFINHRPV